MPDSCGVTSILMTPDLMFAFYIQYCLEAVPLLSSYQFAFLSTLSMPHCKYPPFSTCCF